jgi:hypothetical protein
MPCHSTPAACRILALLAVLLAATASAAEPEDFSPPVGVFDGPSPDARHLPLAEVLKRVVRRDGVDYHRLREDHRNLDFYLAQLAIIEIPKDAAAKTALFIDAYNAWSLALVVRSLPTDEKAWPQWSIRSLSKESLSPWQRFRFELAGKRFTLDQVENEVLRPLGDPRIHFAINCGSRSCPMLAPEPYTAEQLDAQLDGAAGVFASDDAQVRVTDDGSVVANPLLDWFAKDFARAGGVGAFLLGHTDNGKLQSALRSHAKIAYFDYDWRLNLARGERP